MSPPEHDRLPIRMLHDRVLVSMDGDAGERRSTSGHRHPRDRRRRPQAAWAGVVAVGQHVRQVQVGDRVLYDPEDRAEVELQGAPTCCCASATSTPWPRPGSRTARPACTCDVPPPRLAATARRNSRYTPLAADGPLPADMLRAVPAIRRDPLAYLEDVVRIHGDLVAFPMPRTPVLLVNTPDGARRVLQDNHRGYGKRTVQYAALGLVTGQGLLTADGDVWRRRRRIAQPAFHHGRLEAVAEQAAVAGVALRRTWTAAPGSVVDVDRAALRTMLEVVGRTLFAADLAADGERVVEAVDAALQAVVVRARSPLPAVLPGWLPTPSQRRLRRAVATLDDACLGVVRRRRAAGLDDADDDVLALLLRAADAEGGLDEREVRDELVTLVIAGHETVASCLTWALLLLARHPEAQHRLAAELDALPADRPARLGRPARPAVHPGGRRRGPAALPARLGDHAGARSTTTSWTASRSPRGRWSSSARGSCTGGPRPGRSRCASTPTVSPAPAPGPAPAAVPARRLRAVRRRAPVVHRPRRRARAGRADPGRPAARAAGRAAGPGRPRARRRPRDAAPPRRPAAAPGSRADRTAHAGPVGVVRASTRAGRPSARC